MFSDFALNQWLRVRSETATEVLPEYYIAEILQELDLTSYFMDTPCSRDNVPFANATNGWNSGKLTCLFFKVRFSFLYKKIQKNKV